MFVFWFELVGFKRGPDPENTKTHPTSLLTGIFWRSSLRRLLGAHPFKEASSLASRNFMFVLAVSARRFSVGPLWPEFPVLRDQARNMFSVCAPEVFHVFLGRSF